MSDYMKKPCIHCPFRNDVKPFLTDERAEELAYHATNPYTTFPCHKTTVENEDSDEGEMDVVESTKECAGFLTLRAQELGEECMPEGFTPDYLNVYSDTSDMIYAYEEANGS